MADLLRPSARRIPLRRRPRGRVLHVPRSWDPRRRHRGRGVDRQAAHRRTRDGTLRPGQRAGAARRRRVEGARGRRPPGGSAELDVRTPPVGAERRSTGDRGSCGRRLRNAHGRRLGPCGGRGPRRGVRMGRRLEAGRMESLAPHAVRTCAPSERRAARGVGGAGSGVPRPDPLGARARARRGRPRARIDRRVLARPRPTRRARRRPRRLRLLRSSLDRRAVRARSEHRSRGHGGRRVVARRSGSSFTLPDAGDTLPALLVAGALVAAAITAWRTTAWLGRGRA